MASDFKPQPKERGNVILAQDWNTAMGEVVRLGEDTLPQSGGTISGSLLVNGKLGVGTGTAEPGATLEVNGDIKTDGAIVNDCGYGAKFVGFSHKDKGTEGNYALLQKNDGTSFLNASSGKKIHFRINNDTKMTLTGDGALGFGDSTRQMINLWKTSYGIGIQSGTQYYRAAKNFAWYKGGSHNDAELNAGDEGSVQMVLKENGHLGIGTAAPGAKLEVAGTSTAAADNETLVGVKIAPTFNDGDKTGVQRCGLDIAGAADTAGQVSLQLRSGNRSNKYDSNQIAFGFNNIGEYRHALKTRHHANKRFGNAIDFYVWKYLSASDKDDKDTIGTLHTMTLDGGYVGIGTTAPSSALEVNGTVKATKFEGDGSALTGLNAVSKEGDTIAGALTINKTLNVTGEVTAASFVGDGSKLTGIAAAGDSPWTDLADAEGAKGIQYKAGKKVTIGAANSGAGLHILNKNQEAADGTTLILGKTDGTNLRFGYHGDYAWIQSHNDPLAINPLGGNVGIGTKNPSSALDVAGYIVMQKPDADAATELLAKLPNSSLIIGGPAGDSLVFYWKDENGKEHELKLKGTALA